MAFFHSRFSGSSLRSGGRTAAWNFSDKGAIRIAQRRGVQRREFDAREIRTADPGSRSEESELRVASGVSPPEVAADLRQVRAQLVVTEPAQALELLEGEKPGAGDFAVVVDLAPADGDAGRFDHRLHLLGRLGQRRDPPQLTALLDRLPDLRVQDAEKTDPVLGDQALQELVGLESQVPWPWDRDGSGLHPRR